MKNAPSPKFLSSHQRARPWLLGSAILLAALSSCSLSRAATSTSTHPGIATPHTSLLPTDRMDFGTTGTEIEARANYPYREPVSPVQRDQMEPSRDLIRGQGQSPVQADVISLPRERVEWMNANHYQPSRSEKFNQDKH